MKQTVKKFMDDNLCPVLSRKEVDISLPVEIRGFARVGEVETRCCGPVKITANSDFCPGDHDAVLKFVISQRIQVDIPVTFGVKTEIGEEKVDFDDNDADDCRCSGGRCSLETREEISSKKYEESSSKKYEEQDENKDEDKNEYKENKKENRYER